MPDQDIIAKLADDVKVTVKETCAKVAELHSFARIENEYQRGYNEAIRQIAADIRRL